MERLDALLDKFYEEIKPLLNFDRYNFKFWKNLSFFWYLAALIYLIIDSTNDIFWLILSSSIIFSGISVIIKRLSKLEESLKDKNKDREP